ncbi:hypothetical protein HPULCUR_007392 [Helicostylum pulchrum]|uniref:FYVE-type domain-containing protein n=1 Tax=Helicostylum pulchrum TaxID=562976 RepID=A0ABP9Y4M3_9FUNG
MTTTLNYHNKLHTSVASGQLNLVQRLISNGCDPNSPHSVTGLRPIHFAASRGHVNLVQFLIQSCQVDIDATDKEGETALLKAAYAGHLSVIQYLVQSNANPIHQDRDGWTALHNACSCGNLDSVVFLLNQAHVNVNVTSIQGHTPLMNAASKGYLDIVVCLLNGEYNTNPLLKNKFGETAYDVAAAAGEAYLCQLIEQHEHKWYNNSEPYNSLNIHVTIPVLLLEEQDLITNETCWLFNDKVILNKSRVELPNTSWFWLSDWSIDFTVPKHNQGWVVYHKDSKKKRQWMRIMKKSMGTEFDQAVVQEDNTTIIDDEQQQEANSNVLTSLSTAVTRAVFIGSCTTTKPLLQEQISKDDPLLLWESNDQVVDCRRCHRYFNFIVRRHHCRKCGQIICDKCSTQRVYLPPLHIIIPPHQQQQQLQDLNQLSLKPQRICDQCVVHVNNEDLVTKKKRSASIMTECPVCAKKLTEYDTVKEQEHHVQECFNNGSSPIGIRFVGKWLVCYGLIRLIY